MRELRKQPDMNVTPGSNTFPRKNYAQISPMIRENHEEMVIEVGRENGYHSPKENSDLVVNGQSDVYYMKDKDTNSMPNLENYQNYDPVAPYDVDYMTIRRRNRPQPLISENDDQNHLLAHDSWV